MTTLHTDGKYLSPFCFSVFVCLTEMGIPFSCREWSLSGKAHKAAEYRELALNGKVPCLQDDDFSLTESLAIIEYLNEMAVGRGGVSPLPKLVEARAKCRELLSWFRTGFVNLRKERPALRVFDPTRPNSKPEPLSEIAALEWEELRVAVLTALNDESSFLRGPWTIAHTELALLLARVEDRSRDFDSMVRFTSAQLERNSIKSWIARGIEARR